MPQSRPWNGESSKPSALASAVLFRQHRLCPTLHGAAWAALAWRAGGQVVWAGAIGWRCPIHHRTEDRLKFLTTADEIQPRANTGVPGPEAQNSNIRRDGPHQCPIHHRGAGLPCQPGLPLAPGLISPGPLVINSGNGQLHLEGEDFSWLVTSSNSTLTISNRVRTTLKLESLSRPSRASGTNNVLAPIGAREILTPIKLSMLFRPFLFRPRCQPHYLYRQREG